MQLRKATRQKAKIRVNLSGPSGSGKTASGLRLLYGMIGDWSKIAVIDTENNSAELYANHTLGDGFTIGEFLVMPLDPPYSPERCIEAIKACQSDGVEGILFDSASHEWDGKGGCLEINENLASAKFKGNTWAAWSETTPRHQNFLGAITGCSTHIVTTTRSKTDTIQTEDKKVKKIGLKEIQREGFEYELTIHLAIDRDRHLATASKDRTGLFIDKDPFLITEETGRKILEWCESGVDFTSQIADAVEKVNVCNSQEEVELLVETLPILVSQHSTVINAVNMQLQNIRREVAQTSASELQALITKSTSPEALTELRPRVNALPDPHRKDLRSLMAAHAESEGWIWNKEAERFEAKAQEIQQAGNESVPTESPAETSGAANPTEKPADDIIEEYKPKIQAIETPEALTKMLEEVNGLPAEAAKSLRRTVAAKARNSGWVSNPESKAFEYAPAGNAGGSTDQPKAPESQSEQSPTAPAAAPAAQSVAQSQKKEWFVERIGKRIWMQARPGSEESQYTGPYPTDSGSVLDDAFPDYLLGLQQTEGYTFRDLTPEEAAA